MESFKIPSKASNISVGLAMNLRARGAPGRELSQEHHLQMGLVGLRHSSFRSQEKAMEML